MDRHKAIVAIFAILVVVMVAGEAMIYVTNPYDFDSEVTRGEDGVEYTVYASGSARFQIVEMNNGSVAPVERVYVYCDDRYGMVGMSDLSKRTDDVVIELGIRNVQAEKVDAEELREVMISDTQGIAVVFITGAMPSTVYTGSVDDIALEWTRSGGTIYWVGVTMGKYYGTPDGEVSTVSGWEDLFYGEGCFNNSDDYDSADERADSIGEVLCLRSSSTQYGMSVSVPDSKQIGFVSKEGYGTASLARYGSGMIGVIGGLFEESTRSDLAQMIASGVTYSSTMVMEEEVQVWNGEYAGDLDDIDGALVYIFSGGYFTCYGTRYVL